MRHQSVRAGPCSSGEGLSSTSVSTVAADRPRLEADSWPNFQVGRLHAAWGVGTPIHRGSECSRDQALLDRAVGEASVYVQGASLKTDAVFRWIGFLTPRSPGGRKRVATNKIKPTFAVAALATAFGLALLAVGLPSAEAAAARAKLTPHQLAEMSACVDQQGAKSAVGADHCVSFVAPERRHAPVALTDRESDRMAECVDQQTGHGTAGADDTCADFLRWARH